MSFPFTQEANESTGSAEQKKKRPYIGPGWYKNLSNDEYHGSMGTSSSQLKKLIEKTPAHLAYDMAHPKESTDNMNLGTAVHTLILEPEKFDQEFLILPDLNLRNAYDRARKYQIIEQNPGKIALSEDQEDTAKRMAENLGNYIAEHPDLSSMMEDAVPESSVYWWYRTLDIDDDSPYKELLKVRPDAISTTHSVLLDVKSCTDASYTGFKKAIERFYYHVSAAMYLEGVNQCKPLLDELGHFAYTGFVLLCVENQPPYLPASYNLTKNYLDLGKAIYRRCMKKLHDSRQEEKPPGYPADIRDMEPNAQPYFWIV